MVFRLVRIPVLGSRIELFKPCCDLLTFAVPIRHLRWFEEGGNIGAGCLEGGEVRLDHDDRGQGLCDEIKFEED